MNPYAKPYSEACEQNKEPILAVLREIFTEPGLILEIGAGTGQHAVYFARELPATDRSSALPARHPAMDQRSEFTEPASTSGTGHLPGTMAHDSGSGRILRQHHPHHALAGGRRPVPGDRPDVATGIGRTLQPGGAFCLYGPFNDNGRYTSASNAQFDAMLKQRDPASGIRDLI